MRLSLTKTYLRHSALVLVIGITLLACSLLPGYADPASPSATAPGQPTGAATLPSEEVAEPIDAAAIQAEATTSPTVEAATKGPYVLAIRDRYPFFQTKVTIAQSLTARAGQLWIGTVSGTIEEIDPQTGIFGKSISLAPGDGGMLTVFPIQKMVFEGKYLWVHAGFFEGSNFPPGLFAIDPETGEIVREWDLNSPEWMQGYERGGEALDFGFGVSPGKIWIDGHIVDTETFEVMQVSMPTIMTLYAYDGREWMWITAEIGGSCNDLILINVNDPTTGWCEDDWPFFTNAANGDGLGNLMVLAGDKIWMADTGDDGSYVLEAYPADIEQAMETTGPSLSAPSPDSESSIKLFVAGDSLWVLDTIGDKMGYLFRVDLQTGETIDSLDLVGDEGRALGDLPVDIAAEGDNLWVLTTRQLLRIKLP
ncbi:MAG TPA: hypothetical protein VK880_09655 [Anaerolineales bacterium]|nr:hypothetical protein [Anaerolineales bacterium]